MGDPNVDVAGYYNNGLSWSDFVEKSEHNVERMRTFYDAFDFDEDTIAFFSNRTPLQVLAIAEDWCPDVAHNLAVMARICDEVPGMELSIVHRDQAPELMDEYLTDGKKRIPVIAFFDMTFRELARWAGRCRLADEWIFGEVVPDRDFSKLDRKALDAFHEEYDRRYRESYVWETLGEWERLLEDQDY